jgi:hypothetical protein
MEEAKTRRFSTEPPAFIARVSENPSWGQALLVGSDPSSGGLIYND